MSWRYSVEHKRITVQPAANTIAQIALPKGTTLMGSPATVTIGTISAGSDTKTTWKLLCNSDATGKAISVSASGIISGWAPEAQWQGQTVYYPTYSYTDAIGGKTTVQL